ncbi:MAG: 50S ribosomal protein L6, large subunit ribosomal protein L6 [Candidatus Peregrinibacteria bacterium GW2011_GWC2_39_14]|nr:MAG: 50S ribosomal protein L6 [Candidatus Peregrinibacteria bacterium GW2011_GWA2_38_36]KKR06849.1 MAG: 50S ribosomal protein L6, large subunit ribosomal protein L6 [Candidatus Peregrinibacteria bacterium GW2011_GWC2_39_14]
MSRIGKKPVQVPQGVTVQVTGSLVKIKGAKNELSLNIPFGIELEVKDGVITVTRKSDTFKNLHGTIRTLLANMIEGVTKGFEKKLDVQGVGFKAILKGKDLELSLGFSHPVNVTTPEGLVVDIDKEKKNIISIKGFDKQLVGEFAAKLRSLKKPEPYKGKGIRYEGEIIKKKAGKTVAGASGGAK